MSAKGIILTTLATELAKAVAEDEKAENGGCDLSAGLFGPHVSQWLRELAEVLVEEKAKAVVIDDAMVERATMALLGKSRDPVPGIDWWASRQWRVNKVRLLMRKALRQALGQN